MGKFIRKPVIVEANQYQGESDIMGVCSDPRCGMMVHHVHTIHKGQQCSIEKGDWILPEPDGIHFYPVKDKIFRDAYEPLSE